MLDLSTSVAVTQGLDVDTEVATEPADTIVEDKRSVHAALLPSLRVQTAPQPLDAVAAARDVQVRLAG